MPECIPFDIRAMFFTDFIERERQLHKERKHVVKIKRSRLFDDGYKQLSALPNLKEQIKVVF